MRKWIPLSIDHHNDLDKRLAMLARDFDQALVMTDRYAESTGLYQALSRFKILAGFGAAEVVACLANDLESSIQEDDWYMGFLSYGLKSELYQLPNDVRQPTIDFPLLHFFRPRYIVKSDGIVCSMGYDPALDDEASAGVLAEKIRAIQPGIAADVISSGPIIPKVNLPDYVNAVEALQKHIVRGDIYEANYCMEFTAESVTTDPAALFATLMDLSPMPFSAFLKNGEHYVLCASPERYLQKSGNRLFSMPMKGTAARQNSKGSKVLGRVFLRDSKKEQSENIMITDLVRNDLSRVAKPGTVKVDELCGIYPFPGVYQMVSTVSCELKTGIKWAEPIRCSFPMGSMTGAPKRRALELIARYETGSRGLYSGAIGYITPERDYDFNVVIRSLFLSPKEQKAAFWVGSAITAQSNAEDEYNECLLKASVIMKILIP